MDALLQCASAVAACAANVSYIFGGSRDPDLALLLDEFSRVIVPAADGAMGKPAVFDIEGRTPRRADRLRLVSVKRLPKSALWCRYKVLSARVATRSWKSGRAGTELMA